MSFNLPNGAVMEIAAGFATRVPVTALSNASPTVATAANHNLANGDVVAVTSGWSRLTDRVAVVSNVQTGSFVLSGFNTSDVDVYSVGAGLGSIRAIDGWVPISQITEVASSGGEQQFATFGFLEEGDDRQLPTTKSASSITVTVADDPSLPYVAICEAADEAREPRVVRLTLPNGSVIYYHAYVSIASTPTLSRNNLMTRAVTLSLAARPTRYQAA